MGVCVCVSEVSSVEGERVMRESSLISKRRNCDKHTSHQQAKRDPHNENEL